ATADPVAVGALTDAALARLGTRAQTGDDWRQPSDCGPRTQTLDQAPTGDLAGGPLFLHPSPPSRGAGGTLASRFVPRRRTPRKCSIPIGQLQFTRASRWSANPGPCPGNQRVNEGSALYPGRSAPRPRVALAADPVPPDQDA